MRKMFILLNLTVKTFVIVATFMLLILIAGALLFEDDSGFKFLGFSFQLIAALVAFCSVLWATFQYHSLEDWHRPLEDSRESFNFTNQYILSHAYISANANEKRIIDLEHKVAALLERDIQIKRDFIDYDRWFNKVFNWLTYLQDHAPLEAKADGFLWIAVSTAIAIMSAAVGIWSAEIFTFTNEFLCSIRGFLIK